MEIMRRREINTLREDIISALRTEYKSSQQDFFAAMERKEEVRQQELLNAIQTHQQQMKELLDSFKKDLENEKKAQMEIIKYLREEMNGQFLNLVQGQKRDSEQIISAIWDSHKGALWEGKEELRVYNRQWQQIFWYWLATQENMSLSQVKKTFFKGLPKAEGAVRLIQEMELYLLHQFVWICSKYDLKYWMTDGSLLGTVRHEGFVPWDDDMDVGMPRVDFERLKEVLRDNKHFQIVDYYCLTEPRWFSKISKFVDLDSGSSVFIDLFPYDRYDAETQQAARDQYHDRRQELVNKLNQLIPTLKCRYQDVQVEDPKDKAALDAIFEEYTAGFSQNGKWLGWSVEIWESEARTGFPENVIFPCTEGAFEGIPVSVPADAEAWLKQVYGEYMEFPGDMGIQNHIKMFGLDRQEEQIRNFLQQKAAWKGRHQQGAETEAEDESGRA